MSGATSTAVTAEALSDAIIMGDREHPDIRRALALVFGPEEGERRLAACPRRFVVLITAPGSEPLVFGVDREPDIATVRRVVASGVLGAHRVVGELLLAEPQA